MRRNRISTYPSAATLQPTSSPPNTPKNAKGYNSQFNLRLASSVCLADHLFAGRLTCEGFSFSSLVARLSFVRESFLPGSRPSGTAVKQYEKISNNILLH